MTRLTSISFPLANYFEISGTGPGTHLAVDYEDTTEGAVHCFQDDYGNWHSYTFGQVCDYKVISKAIFHSTC